MTPNGFTNSRATSATNPLYDELPEDNELDQPENPLDSQESQKRLSQIQEWYDQEMRLQSANRFQMALDEDYYDSMQWSVEDAQVLMDRGQAPLVFNEIKPTIDWILGTERRTRIDHKVLARRKDEGSRKDAEIKSMLLKYLSDVNKTPFSRSFAFESAVKAGVGWIESGVRGDPTEELIYTRNEDWRNVLYDSNANELDLSDGRYLFRNRWLDADIAIAYFPERAEIIKSSITTNQQDAEDEEAYYLGARVTQAGFDYQPTANVGKYMPYDGSAKGLNARERVKMTECWYKVPVLSRKFSSGEFENQPFDKDNPEHVEALRGQYSLYDKLEMQMRCAIFCDGGLVADSESPYKHKRFPLVPVWCYRRRRDKAPYGAIRGLRDPQDDLNKRQSKALWMLSANGIIADDDAVEDWDELREEAARPDFVIAKKKGAFLEFRRDIQLAEEQLKLMDRNVQHIRNVSGITAENLGRQTNASSGVAITARQEQGSVSTTQMFDNLRYAVQLVGEIELSNVEQFYTEQKVVRITGEKGQPKYEEINVPDENGNIINDITQFQTDFVVSEQDFRSTLRQAMFESLFDITGRLAQMNPQVALNLLDLVVDMADLPNKQQLVDRIRSLNGQADPDAEESPEAAAAKAEGAKAQAMQQEIAMETMRNQLAKLVAETDKLDAQALTERIKAMYAALQAGQVVATVPNAAAVADEIMKGAGFKPTNQEQQAVNQAAEVAPVQPLDIDPMSGAAAESAMQGVNQGIETIENDGVRNV
jgi:uncharacterized protein YheU (UPF0270 family)